MRNVLLVFARTFDRVLHLKNGKIVGYSDGFGDVIAQSLEISWAWNTFTAWYVPTVRGQYNLCAADHTSSVTFLCVATRWSLIALSFYIRIYHPVDQRSCLLPQYFVHHESPLPASPPLREIFLIIFREHISRALSDQSWALGGGVPPSSRTFTVR